MTTWKRTWLWLPPIVYMAVIFYYSSQSEPLPQVTAIVWDKLLHLAEYGGLAVLFCRALRGEGFGWMSAIVVTLFATSLYGASDEWHQSFVPLRESDIRDWFADTVGAATGVLLYFLGRTKVLHDDR